MKNNIYLRTTYFANGVFVFASSLVYPIFALYLNDFKVNVFEISLTSTIFMVSAALFLVLISLYGDKIKSKTTFLIFGFFIRTVVWFAYIFVGDIWHVYVLQIFLGLGEAIGSTMFEVVVAEHLDDGQHVRDYSEWKLIESIASAIAAALGGVVVQFYGFQTLFGVMVVLSLLSILIFYMGLRKRETVSHSI